MVKDDLKKNTKLKLKNILNTINYILKKVNQ